MSTDALEQRARLETAAGTARPRTRSLAAGASAALGCRSPGPRTRPLGEAP